MSFPSSLSQLLGITSEDYQESRFLAWYERFLEKSPEYPKITLDAVDPALLNEVEYEEDYEREECSKVVGPFTTNQLYNQLINTLEGSDLERMEGELLDLIGYEHVEFASLLLANRQQILRAKQGSFSSAEARMITEQSSQLNLPHGPSISFVSATAKQEMKQLRKWKSRGLIPPDEPFNDLNQAKQELTGRIEGISLPNVFTTMTPKMMSLQGKICLPVETQHFDQATYEEFIIPYACGSEKDRQRMESIQPVVISNLDTLLQCAFQGYKTLNRMQSAVFSIAHHSNENLLVCAPTGAGKTDVAMLTITKVIRNHLLESSSPTGWNIAKNDFKIVYVAPMKALAAEITDKFARRLAPFGLGVREYTGDMQLTRREINGAQLIVTTPEKWDVITRRGIGDQELVGKVKLLIVDEVHLLQEDRGPVIESIIARTLRETEISQRMVRIVGLSATLPNYIDVAQFLRVDSMNGLFVFGDAFRPVPLTQHFVGIKGRSQATFQENLNQVAFEKCREFLQAEHQVMVFVHARMETVKTAKRLLQMARDVGCANLFLPNPKILESHHHTMDIVSKSKNQELRELIKVGVAFHNAGMLRNDRNLVERLFSEGLVRVLCCTATLAWGVNLPAHAVIIKGTQVYDQSKGDFVPLGVLDVLQIFGRAGRPQYETHGEGLILTPHTDMARYINSVLAQTPIESQFLSHLADNLNAEIALDTVSNIDEAVAWLRDTYLYVRMRKNPLAYGITPLEATKDPALNERLRRICLETARRLCAVGMINFQEPTSLSDKGALRISEVGRIASMYYLGTDTVEEFGKLLRPNMTEEDILAAVSSASEFKNLRVREEELSELDELYQGSPLKIRHDPTTYAGKASLLIIAHLARYELYTFSLVSDGNYVNQNAPRIFRALFEIVKSQGWLNATKRALGMAKAYEQRIWPSRQHPLWQFVPRKLKPEVMLTLEKALEKRYRNQSFAESLELLRRIPHKELEALVDNPRATVIVQKLADCFPRASLDVRLRPIDNKCILIEGELRCDHVFDEEIHEGLSEHWWLFISDPSSNIMHGEELEFSKLIREQKFSVHLPITDQTLPSLLYFQAISEKWLYAECLKVVQMADIKLPLKSDPAYAQPSSSMLPFTVLEDPILEGLYERRHQSTNNFDQIQSYMLPILYHQDQSLIIATPPGTGFEVLAELAIWRILQKYNGRPENQRHAPPSILYITDEPAERASQWRDGWTGALNFYVTESIAIPKDDCSTILVLTPEQLTRLMLVKGNFWSKIALIVAEGIHSIHANSTYELGLTLLLSRLSSEVRIVALATLMANLEDIASWLRNAYAGIGDLAIFNFPFASRPVPLAIQIEGFSGRNNAQRMAAMDRPLYRAIVQDHPATLKPILIFVPSRRQTRLTALALMSYVAYGGNPYQFLQLDSLELEDISSRVKSAILRHTLSFGIVLYHDYMSIEDRMISLNLFTLGKASVMIVDIHCKLPTNTTAYLTIVKGMGRNNAKGSEYSFKELLQITKSTGRPGIDSSARLLLMVNQNQRFYYRHFLSEPLIVESPLTEPTATQVLADIINHEIAQSNMKEWKDVVLMLQKTLLAVRINLNPSYYGLAEAGTTKNEDFLASLANQAIKSLEIAGCITVRGKMLEGTKLGRIASYDNFDYKTIENFDGLLEEDTSLNSLIQALSLAKDLIEDNYEGPKEEHVLHNLEEKVTKKLPTLRQLFWLNQVTFDHTGIAQRRALLFLTAYLAGIGIPNRLLPELKSFVQRAKKLAHVMTRVAQLKGFLDTFIRCVWLEQALAIGRHPSLLQTTNYEPREKVEQYGIQCKWNESRAAIEITPKGTNIVGGHWYAVIGHKEENRLVLVHDLVFDDCNLSMSLPKEEDPKRLTIFFLSAHQQGIDQEYPLVSVC